MKRTFRRYLITGLIYGPCALFAASGAIAIQGKWISKLIEQEAPSANGTVKVTLDLEQTKNRISGNFSIISQSSNSINVSSISNGEIKDGQRSYGSNTTADGVVSGQVRGDHVISANLDFKNCKGGLKLKGHVIPVMDSIGGTKTQSLIWAQLGGTGCDGNYLYWEGILTPPQEFEHGSIESK